MRETGFVRRFFIEKKFGFINRQGSPDLFFHVSDFAHGRPQLVEEGAPVSFGVESTARGLRAVKITLEPPAAGEARP